MSEFLALKKVLLGDGQETESRWLRWNVELSSWLENPKNPVAVAALLLAAGHPESIPENWYAPSADQTIRTRMISQLGQWLSIDEISQITGTIALTDAESQYHIQAVLCLAIAESTPEVLAEWWRNRPSDSRMDLQSLANLPSSALHSAADLLTRRLSEADNFLDSASVDSDSHDLHVKKIGDLTIESPLAPNSQSNVQWAKLRRGDSELDFIRIPAGYADAEKTIVPAFWMSATEVPAELFDDFRQEQPDCWNDVMNRPAPKNSQAESGVVQSAPGDPATCVSWSEALNFCNWLSHAGDLAQCYHAMDDVPTAFQCTDFFEDSKLVKNSAMPPNGFRLPTSHEWSHACAAGATTRFHTGADDLIDGRSVMERYAWFAENSWTSSSLGPLRRVRCCGTKLPNAWGLFDMMGNVREWCWTADGARTQMLRSGSVSVERHECVIFDETPTRRLRDTDSGNGLRLVIDRWPE